MVIMKKHTKIFLISRGLYQPNMMADDLDIMCEYCGQNRMVDTNHISPRGFGSSKLKDHPENLIGMCRHCHQEFKAKRISKEDCWEKVSIILGL